ncbi:MAG TPA: hypothetical protein DCS93_28655 [Microscillaceae bacterium]|nr:hypothetical protein [Microscillaceae bacterium]
MTHLLKTPLGRLRILAFAEGSSFLLLLFITMPLKYAFSYPAPNQILGIVHGLLFVSYVLLVLQVKIDLNWPWKKAGKALLASIIPFGTFWADKHLFQK